MGFHTRVAAGIFSRFTTDHCLFKKVFSSKIAISPEFVCFYEDLSGVYYQIRGLPLKADAGERWVGGRGDLAEFSRHKTRPLLMEFSNNSFFVLLLARKLRNGMGVKEISKGYL